MTDPPSVNTENCVATSIQIFDPFPVASWVCGCIQPVDIRFDVVTDFVTFNTQNSPTDPTEEVRSIASCSKKWQTQLEHLCTTPEDPNRNEFRILSKQTLRICCRRARQGFCSLGSLPALSNECMCRDGN